MDAGDGPGDRYRAYLACLNERRFDDLGGFVHDPVVHNGRRLSVAAFGDLLRRDVAEIPDLHYAIETLVTDADQVACRIRFDCTPAGFRGLPAAQEPISFVEHAFYRYEAGRIAEIRSLVDMDAIRDQLGVPR
ncbi:ester cyclase [Pseudonocardia kongjuensis]|uniref:Ester cyclase n=1 Tax=Pseudonocardia kongjuensis TaxID=102227 RepID=A0ABP4IAL7_9PSEU